MVGPLRQVLNGHLDRNTPAVRHLNQLPIQHPSLGHDNFPISDHRQSTIDRFDDQFAHQLVVLDATRSSHFGRNRHSTTRDRRLLAQFGIGQCPILEFLIGSADIDQLQQDLWTGISIGILAL